MSPDLVERAKMRDAREVAESLGAKFTKRSGGERMGPCIVCGGDDRFGVNNELWNCRGCGKGGDTIALVQHVLGLEFQGAVEWLTNEKAAPTQVKPQPRSEEALRREREQEQAERRLHEFNLKIAAHVASEMSPLIGTPGEEYLRRIRLIATSAIADVISSTYAIGWHDGVLFREPGHPLDGQRLGAIIALLRDPVTAKLTGAISRTYVHGGRKVGKAKNLAGSGVVQLSPDDEVLQGIHIAEGLETALDMMAKGFRPMWSCGSTTMMAKFPILNAIESITIFADNDENEAGEKAAREVERRWLEAGRETIVAVSPVCGDFNDITMAATP